MTLFRLALSVFLPLTFATISQAESAQLQLPGMETLQAAQAGQVDVVSLAQGQFLTQVSLNIATANTQFMNGNYSHARKSALVAKALISQSSQIKPEVKIVLSQSLDNFDREIENLPDCMFSKACQRPGKDNIYLLHVKSVLVGLNQSLNPQGPIPPVIKQPGIGNGPIIPGNPGTGPIIPGPNQPPGGGITLPVLPNLPGNPINPINPIPFPGQFTPTFGQEPLPIMDATFQAILDAMGVLKVDYAKRNRDLRKQYGYRTNDYIAQQIIKDHAKTASFYTGGTNLLMVIPVYGFAASVAAFPLDLFMTIQHIVEMNIQLADLYYSGLTPREMKMHANIAFGAAFGIKALVHFQKSYTAIKAGQKVGGAGIGLINSTIKTFSGLTQRITTGVAQKVAPQVVGGATTTKVGEKATIEIASGLLPILTKLNEKVVLMTSTKAVGAAGAWAGAGAAATLSAITYGWVYEVGQGMNLLYRGYHSQYRQDNIDNFRSLMRSQDLAMPFISLMTGAIKSSVEDIYELKDSDRRLQIVGSMMKNLGINEEANEPYYQALYNFFMEELLLPAGQSKLPARLKGRLKTAHLGHREIIGEIILAIMLADDHFRTETEREYFYTVALAELDLTGEGYVDYFDAKDHFIIQQNKGIELDDASVLGYDISILQNKAPLSHASRRWLKRNCNSGKFDKQRCEALNRKQETPIGIELDIESPIRDSDPKLGHEPNMDYVGA